jgi:hypothetical protein
MLSVMLTREQVAGQYSFNYLSLSLTRGLDKSFFVFTSDSYTSGRTTSDLVFAFIVGVILRLCDGRVIPSLLSHLWRTSLTDHAPRSHRLHRPGHGSRLRRLTSRRSYLTSSLVHPLPTHRLSHVRTNKSTRRQLQYALDPFSLSPLRKPVWRRPPTKSLRNGSSHNATTQQEKTTSNP